MKRILALLILVLAVGCGTESNNGNNGNNGTNNGTSGSNNGTAGTNNGTTDTSGVDNSNAEYANGYELRITDLTFSQEPAQKLNQLLAPNFDQELDFPIIILLSFTQINPEAGTLMLRGGSGLKTDMAERFDWDPEATGNDTGAGTIVAQNGAFAAELPLFEFVATFVFEEDIEKVILPIRQLNITGNMELLDGGTSAKISDGVIAGYFTKEDGDTTRIAITPGATGITITTLFGANKLNFNTTTGQPVEAGSAEADAWFITGTFNASETRIN